MFASLTPHVVDVHAAAAGRRGRPAYRTPRRRAHGERRGNGPRRQPRRAGAENISIRRLSRRSPRPTRPSCSSWPPAAAHVRRPPCCRRRPPRGASPRRRRRTRANSRAPGPGPSRAAHSRSPRARRAARIGCSRPSRPSPCAASCTWRPTAASAPTRSPRPRPAGTSLPKPCSPRWKTKTNQSASPRPWCLATSTARRSLDR